MLFRFAFSCTVLKIFFFTFCGDFVELLMTTKSSCDLVEILTALIKICVDRILRIIYLSEVDERNEADSVDAKSSVMKSFSS